MPNSKYQTQTLTLQQKAYNHYIQHQYSQSLHLYTQCLKQPSLPPITQLHIQTTLCIIHMHMHNYVQAYHLLEEVENRLLGCKQILVNNINQNAKKDKNKNKIIGTTNYSVNQNNQNVNVMNNSSNSRQMSLQYYLITLKVQICLMLIQLVNSNRQHANKYLNNIFSILDEIGLQKANNSNKNTIKNNNMDNKKNTFAIKNTLWISVMNMLFQVSKVQKFISQHDNEYNNQRNNNKQDGNALINISPILLTSLSLSISLTSNIQLAYNLQYYCHKLLTASLTPQIIPTLISCKHLLTLTQKQNLNYPSANQAYKVQFNKLMNTPQIYGISQQTLFRGYQDKIQIGKEIVGRLMQYQREIQKQRQIQKNTKVGSSWEDESKGWIYSRVIYKLQQYLYNMQNNNQSIPQQKHRQQQNISVQKQTLINTLNTLSSPSGPHILSYMMNSQLVQSVLEQQQNKINRLIRSIKYVGYSYAWRDLIMLPPRIEDTQQFQNINDINNNRNNINMNTKVVRNNNNRDIGNKQEYNYKVFKKGTQINNNMNIKDSRYIEQYQRQERYTKQYINNNNNNNFNLQNNGQSTNKLNTNLNINKNYSTNQQQINQQQQRERERERQQRLIREKQQQNQQYEKYQQFRSRQDKQSRSKSKQIQIQKQRQKQIDRQKIKINKYQEQYQNQNQTQQISYNQNTKNMYANKGNDRNIIKQQSQKERIQAYQRDLSKDDKKYTINTINNNKMGQKKINRKKLQHVNVIQKSPIKYNTNRSLSPSPYHNKDKQNTSYQQQQQYQNSRINQINKYEQQRQRERQRLEQNQKINKFNYKKINQLNSSKIANHKNNVYLDSDTSKFINPLQDLQEDYVINTNPNANVNTNGSKNINQNNTYTFNKINKSGVNSKIQRRQQILPHPQLKQQTSTFSNNIQINQNQNYNTNPKQQNIMSILKNQNSRIKRTQKQIANLNMSQKRQADYPSTMKNQYATTQPQLINQPQPINQNSNNLNQNQSNYLISPRPNISNSRINQNMVNPSSIKNSNLNSNFNANMNINMNQIFNSNTKTNHSQQQVQFNNVDILIQPAINPNNVSNLISHRQEREDMQDIEQFDEKQRRMRIQQNKQGKMILQNREDQRNTSNFGLNVQPNKQSQINPQQQTFQNINKNQRSGTSGFMKKTDSNLIVPSKKLQKLTPKSPYIKKLTKLCFQGQYFVKRHFSSDGGQQKFVQLNDNIIKWAVDQDKIATKYQSYKLKDIKGIAYGKVTQTFLKQCNKKLLPWLCFSLILQKRTLDFYCTDQIDPVIWLPGITAALVGQSLNLKYPKKKSKDKSKQRQERNQDVPVSLFTPGRVLWKRVLMKLQQEYIKPLKKNHKGHKGYKNINARAIILWNQQFTKKNKLKSQL